MQTPDRKANIYASGFFVTVNCNKEQHSGTWPRVMKALTKMTLSEQLIYFFHMKAPKEKYFRKVSEKELLRISEKFDATGTFEISDRGLLHYHVLIWYDHEEFVQFKVKECQSWLNRETQTKEDPKGISFYAEVEPRELAAGLNYLTKEKPVSKRVIFSSRIILIGGEIIPSPIQLIDK